MMPKAKLEAMGMDEYEAAKKRRRGRAGKDSMTPIRPFLLHRPIWTEPRLPRPTLSRKRRTLRPL